MTESNQLAKSDARKTYVPPTLVVHGDVEKITGWKGIGSEDFSGLSEGLGGGGGSGFGGS